MSLNIPSFLTITPDETGQKASLSVLDQTVPHQRAMWGMFSCLFLRGLVRTASHWCLTFYFLIQELFAHSSRITSSAFPKATSVS